MAILTIVEAARVTGVSRSQLYRYIRAGKLSRTPAGHFDTAELLRAGLMLHVPSVPSAHDATLPPVSAVPDPVPHVPSADTATLERLIDVLQRELDASRERETLLAQRLHDRETQLTQMAHERETQLLQIVTQMQQRYDRLLDMPRQAAQAAPGSTITVTREVQERGRVSTRQPGALHAGHRGAMRQRIVALLRDEPNGLTPAEMQERFGSARSLTDTVLGMRRDGLLRQTVPQHPLRPCQLLPTLCRTEV